MDPEEKPNGTVAKKRPKFEPFRISVKSSVKDAPIFDIEDFEEEKRRNRRLITLNDSPPQSQVKKEDGSKSPRSHLMSPRGHSKSPRDRSKSPSGHSDSPKGSSKSPRRETVAVNVEDPKVRHKDVSVEKAESKDVSNKGKAKENVVLKECDVLEINAENDFSIGKEIEEKSDAKSSDEHKHHKKRKKHEKREKSEKKKKRRKKSEEESRDKRHKKRRREHRSRSKSKSRSRSSSPVRRRRDQTSSDRQDSVFQSRDPSRDQSWDQQSRRRSPSREWRYSPSRFESRRRSNSRSRSPLLRSISPQVKKQKSLRKKLSRRKPSRSQSPPAKSPMEKSPRVKSPRAKSPKAKSPKVKSPRSKSPKNKPPRDKSKRDKSPKVKSVIKSPKKKSNFGVSATGSPLWKKVDSNTAKSPVKAQSDESSVKLIAVRKVEPVVMKLDLVSPVSSVKASPEPQSPSDDTSPMPLKPSSPKSFVTSPPKSPLESANESLQKSPYESLQKSPDQPLLESPQKSPAVSPYASPIKSPCNSPRNVSVVPYGFDEDQRSLSPSEVVDAPNMAESESSVNATEAGQEVNKSTPTAASEVKKKVKNKKKIKKSNEEKKKKKKGAMATDFGDGIRNPEDDLEDLLFTKTNKETKFEAVFNDSDLVSAKHNLPTAVVDFGAKTAGVLEPTKDSHRDKSPAFTPNVAAEAYEPEEPTQITPTRDFPPLEPPPPPPIMPGIFPTIPFLSGMEKGEQETKEVESSKLDDAAYSPVEHPILGSDYESSGEHHSPVHLSDISTKQSSVESAVGVITPAEKIEDFLGRMPGSFSAQDTNDVVDMDMSSPTNGLNPVSPDDDDDIIEQLHKEFVRTQNEDDQAPVREAAPRTGTNVSENWESLAYAPGIPSPIPSPLHNVSQDPIVLAYGGSGHHRKDSKGKERKHKKSHKTKREKKSGPFAKEKKDIEEALNRVHRRARVEDEMKHALKVYFKRNDITKEEYKMILRKAVPQVTNSSHGIDPERIRSLMKKYVAKYKGMRQRKTETLEDSNSLTHTYSPPVFQDIPFSFSP